MEFFFNITEPKLERKFKTAVKRKLEVKLPGHNFKVTTKMLKDDERF